VPLGRVAPEKRRLKAGGSQDCLPHKAPVGGFPIRRELAIRSTKGYPVI
jgi:hypothetical protein